MARPVGLNNFRCCRLALERWRINGYIVRIECSVYCCIYWVEERRERTPLGDSTSHRPTVTQTLSHSYSERLFEPEGLHHLGIHRENGNHGIWWRARLMPNSMNCPWHIERCHVCTSPFLKVVFDIVGSRTPILEEPLDPPRLQIASPVRFGQIFWLAYATMRLPARTKISCCFYLPPYRWELGLRS